MLLIKNIRGKVEWVKNHYLSLSRWESTCDFYEANALLPLPMIGTGHIRVYPNTLSQLHKFAGKWLPLPHQGLLLHKTSYHYLVMCDKISVSNPTENELPNHGFSFQFSFQLVVSMNLSAWILFQRVCYVEGWDVIFESVLWWILMGLLMILFNIQVMQDF